MGGRVIDFNTHPVQVRELVEQDPGFIRAVRDIFGFHVSPQPLSTFLCQLNVARIDDAVLLPIDCTTAHGCTIGSNDQVAKLVSASNRFIGFASVDPNDRHAERNLEHAVHQLGLRGLSLDPALQRFQVAEDPALAVFSARTELELPVVVHCGLNWSPKASALHPAALEPVVERFPSLRIVIPHFGWPWVEEALMLAVKYRSVTLDTAILYAGTPESSLRRVLAERVGVDVINGALADQVVFGSDYPRVDPKRVVAAIKAIGLSPGTMEKIMSTNANRLLGSSQA